MKNVSCQGALFAAVSLGGVQALARLLKTFISWLRRQVKSFSQAELWTPALGVISWVTLVPW